eukprot:TRINITY_DN2663_c0_g2_i1.p1 TRINITY_DN2663_c0_g2~~TRINITY_DN2663_c0_g2_i1.p1  ORF type:complete len:379 (+),score=75.56 TRINITY_DN2663_c0_g2_i1:27-1139(+)
MGKCGAASPDWLFDLSCPIAFDRTNPKRPGSASAIRYDGYKGACTIGDALQKGALKQDLKNDQQKGYLRQAREASGGTGDLPPLAASFRAAARASPPVTVPAKRKASVLEKPDADTEVHGLMPPAGSYSSGGSSSSSCSQPIIRPTLWDRLQARGEPQPAQLGPQVVRTEAHRSAILAKDAEATVDPPACPASPGCGSRQGPDTPQQLLILRKEHEAELLPTQPDEDEQEEHRAPLRHETGDIEIGEMQHASLMQSQHVQQSSQIRQQQQHTMRFSQDLHEDGPRVKQHSPNHQSGLISPSSHAEHHMPDRITEQQPSPLSPQGHVQSRTEPEHQQSTEQTHERHEPGDQEEEEEEEVALAAFLIAGRLK